MIGGNVLKDGLPGFEFQLVDGGCTSREETSCEDVIFNCRLDVHRGDDSVSLWNGETGRFGNFQVVCLTAQRVDYGTQCADAGLPAVSWVVIRVD